MRSPGSKSRRVGIMGGYRITPKQLYWESVYSNVYGHVYSPHFFDFLYDC